MADSETSLRPPLVLLADDQEWSSRSLESILGPNGYAVLRAFTGRQAMELVRSAQPDLLILDAKLPDLTGIQVCQLVRADPRFNASTPIVITSSGPAERTQRLAAYEAGAWEYFGQPIDSEVLLLKLNTYMRAKREADHVRSESLVDDATGLYTLRGLACRAHEIGALAQRRHEALACLAFAPDVEPRSGEQGERLWQWAALIGEVTRRTGRASDVVGRLGQMEFAVIAPETEAAGALHFLERLRRAIEALPVTVDGAEQPVGIRAGYSAVPDFAESPVDAVELLLRATSTLRQLRSEADGEWIRAFGAPPLNSASP